MPTPRAITEPDRRTFIRQGLASGAALAALGCTPSSDGQQGSASDGKATTTAAVPPFELEEVGVAELQSGMSSGKYTASRLVELYNGRIEAVDRGGPRINSVIELNPEAMSIAAVLDAERKAGKIRGSLHGIPVLLKDNIDTADRMKTSAGSLALAQSVATADSGVAARLRAAGAVILGKVNLSEWANIRSLRSTSGWSGRGGLTRNPYALDRNACGSSAGTGASIAASLATLGIGTETDGSIVCPSNANGLVGIKPTVGLVSRAGIIPISHTQDTAGPMCRSVRDAAALLSAIAGPDPRDPATAATGHIEADYTSFCVPAGLQGAKVGVLRQLFNAGPQVNQVMDGVLAALKGAGAQLTDPVSIPSLEDIGEDEFTVLLYELKADLNAYLATPGPGAPYKTLADLIKFNEENKATEMLFFGQETFIAAEAKGSLASPEYRKALARCAALSRTQGLDKAFAGGKVDVLIAPTGGPAWVTDLVNGDHFGGGSSTASAVSGYPAITVPAGHVFGLPVGVTFMGPAWSEGKLVRYAYAFEQATKVRKAPTFPAHAATDAA